jgi:two-component system alkaline phosphatase synthesis response regulator PhoP
MAQKILIVEDDLPLAEILGDKLKEAGFEVLLARNGREGIDTALGEHPDLVLLDIIMPVMDGLTAAAKIREDEWGRTVPIVILTNLSEADTVSAAVKSGIYDFLIKADWSIDDVVGKVKSKLG